MNPYPAYRLAQLASCKLPQPFAYWLGRRIADCFYFLDGRGRRAVKANLAQIERHLGRNHTPSELARMARLNFEHFGKYLVDFFRFARITPEAARRLVDIEDFHHFEKAHALKKGIIIITAHLGNWELGGAVLSALGHRLTAVFHPERTNSVNRLFQQHRTGRGIHGIAFGQAARALIRVLKAGGMAAMLADRDYSPHHQLTEFFGAPARLPSGPARMAFHTGAVVLPAFIFRQPDDRFCLRFHPPLLPEAHAAPDVLHLRIRDILELEIGRHPLQWFMFEPFWRNCHGKPIKPA